MNPATLGRILARACAFAWNVSGSLVRYWLEVRLQRGQARRGAQARWLHEACLRQLRAQNITLAVQGIPPGAGLIVANHLSYLDIIALSAALPCVFVSKEEIAGWPIFGIFGRLSGTLFLDRKRRAAVGTVAAQMGETLRAGVPLVLFPEGTSSRGDELLPFRSSLFEPVADLGCPVTAAAICYSMPEGSVRDEVHWWGTMTLVPHLLNLLGKRRIDVTVRFGPARARSGDRKSIARELHGEVLSLLQAH